MIELGKALFAATVAGVAALAGVRERVGDHPPDSLASIRSRKRL